MYIFFIFICGLVFIGILDKTVHYLDFSLQRLGVGQNHNPFIKFKATINEILVDFFFDTYCV